MLSLSVGEESRVWGLATLVAGSGDTLQNDGLLELGVGVVLWEIVKRRNDTETFLMTIA